ncbi:MAG: hypothetical protein M1484_00025 [Patescibacteria group bacterium]|nr:hypothetical protein [Patescibacteria group bacterium]
MAGSKVVHVNVGTVESVHLLSEITREPNDKARVVDVRLTKGGFDQVNIGARADIKPGQRVRVVTRQRIENGATVIWSSIWRAN